MYILSIEDHNGEKQSYKVKSIQDLAPLYESYPNLKDVMMNSDSLEEGLQNIAEYLSSGHVTATVESTELSKGIKSALTALGIALGAAIPLNHPQVSNAMPHHQSKVVSHKKDDFGSKKEDHFLWNIMQVESSGGKNTNHKPVPSGKYKGEVAMGRWGLLKPTADEMIQRMDKAGVATPQIKKLLGMNRDNADRYLKDNPQTEVDIARFMARLVGKRYGHPHKMAWAWNSGHNTSLDKITDTVLANSDYVSKYRQASKLNPMAAKNRNIASINKAESTSDLASKIHTWFNKRKDRANAPLRDSTFVNDPSRLRDKDLDVARPKDLMEKLKQQIKKNNT